MDRKKWVFPVHFVTACSFLFDCRNVVERFVPKYNRGKYCPDCVGYMKKLKAAQRKRKQREKCHAEIGRPEQEVGELMVYGIRIGGCAFYKAYPMHQDPLPDS